MPFEYFILSAILYPLIQTIKKRHINILCTGDKFCTVKLFGYRYITAETKRVIYIHWNKGVIGEQGDVTESIESA